MILLLSMMTLTRRMNLLRATSTRFAFSSSSSSSYQDALPAVYALNFNITFPCDIGNSEFAGVDNAGVDKPAPCYRTVPLCPLPQIPSTRDIICCDETRIVATSQGKRSKPFIFYVHDLCFYVLSFMFFSVHCNA